MYRIAAAGSSSIDPKLPCLSTSMCPMLNSWAILLVPHVEERFVRLETPGLRAIAPILT